MVAVFRHGGEQTLLLAFTLDAQTHNHIRALAGVLNGRGDGAAQLLNARGDERRRRTKHDICAHRRQAVNVASRNAGVHHVAADGNLRALQTAQMLAHGQHVQQSLRRMLVHAVARVDDARADMLRQQRRRAAHRMADDDDVRAHLVEGHAGVDERFALGDARRAGGDIRRRRGHVLARQLEGHARARGILIEQGHNGFSL